MKKEKVKKSQRDNPYALPKIRIGKKTYYCDDRLRQLRNVDNPHDFIDF